MFTVIFFTLILALTVGSYQLFRTADRVADWRYTTKLGEVGNLLTFLLFNILAIMLGLLVGVLLRGYF